MIKNSEKEQEKFECEIDNSTINNTDISDLCNMHSC